MMRFASHKHPLLAVKRQKRPFGPRTTWRGSIWKIGSLQGQNDCLPRRHRPSHLDQFTEVMMDRRLEFLFESRIGL